MDIWESIQQQAMLAVVEPDDDAWLRRVFRHYSRTFSTPLHVVRDIPLDDVLLAVYEDMFESMDEEDRMERLDWLLMTPSQRAEHKDVETVIAQRDDAFLDQLNKQVAAGETIERKEGSQVPQTLDKLSRVVARAKKRAAKVAGVSLPDSKPPPVPRSAAEPKTPPMLGDLPEIRMSFGKETSNLGGKDWSALDPLGPPPGKKKA